MNKSFQLPGAPRFREYLVNKLKGDLVATRQATLTFRVTYEPGETPNNLDKWMIELNGEPLGNYTVTSCAVSKIPYNYQFMGRIPGINKMTKDSIILHSTKSKNSDRELQRFDGWTEIPFP